MSNDVEKERKILMWIKLNDIGKTGSENGIILEDEEYKESCRITLEKCSKYCAITCGVYGLMMHTAFCDFCDSKKVYEKMKNDLQNFIDADVDENKAEEFCEWFVSNY